MTLRFARNLAWFVIPLAALYLVLQAMQTRPVVLSRWSLPASMVRAQVDQALARGAAPLIGEAQPVPAVPQSLAAFHSGSALQERAAGGQVEYYRRTMPGGGELAYFVTQLSDQVHIELINADGATPASDETGDTIWADRQQHLATVAEMVAAPYAARDGLELLGAMAFGFHGAARTANEGSVVINGVIHRINQGRGVLCITPMRQAIIGLFDQQQLAQCEQAVGGGPVILWQGKIANPAVAAPTDEYLPFNPLGEDFVQLDWRIKIYNGTYPKTAVCVGDGPGGGSFLVLATSSGVVGVDFARALRDMGCRDALGGDDDTSTQATWRGQAVWSRQPREVPDAIGVYVRR